MKTTLEIPDDLYRMAKVHAAHENRRMRDLVSEGLRHVLGVDGEKTGSSRVEESAATMHAGSPRHALDKELLAELSSLGVLWGVTPAEAVRRVARVARDANASRSRALEVLSKIQREPLYPAGRVQRMIEEADRLRKESWD